ncbi:MAG: T9SS type A sorting domain-containing protein [Ignavibacteriaceae bacterium]|nr:T9SS type A sorting domain-containing protein [Ignavibacteriaceae bacterium]
MKYTILLLVIGIILLVIPINISRPSFNGADPGCGGGGCHSFEDGIVSASATDLEVQISVSGTSNDVAGELVDAFGTVVDVNNGTSSNPFTLTAPGPGTYIVNAGHKSPLKWDSASVSITVTDVGENPSNPSAFKLYDNYPNPFNPSTTLRYSIPEASFTSVKIYDALGNEVSSLVNETKPAGTYEVEFNASDLSSGIYYYTLNVVSFSETKKMILMK